MPRKAAQPSLADEQSVPGGAAAVDRAVCLLTAFRSGDGALGLSELAARTRLHKSTALRLLTSLAHGGLLRRTPEGLWALGPQLLRLAALHTAAFSLEEVVLPEMRALVARTGESVSFHVRQGEQRLCLFRVDSPQLLRDHTRAGDLLPLERGAGGRVLLAFAGAAGHLYEQVRREGWLMITGDRVPGLAGVSAPVWNAVGELVGALTLTVPEPRWQPEFGPALRESASRLCAALGAPLTRGCAPDQCTPAPAAGPSAG